MPCRWLITLALPLHLHGQYSNVMCIWVWEALALWLWKGLLGTVTYLLGSGCVPGAHLGWCSLSSQGFAFGMTMKPEKASEQGILSSGTGSWRPLRTLILHLPLQLLSSPVTLGLFSAAWKWKGSSVPCVFHDVGTGRSGRTCCVHLSPSILHWVL